jgi:hypothetical protein
VPTGSKSIKKQLRECLDALRPPEITEGVWKELLQALAPVSEGYLRDLLRDTGLPFAQPYAGVRQHTLEELEESLTELWKVYAEAIESGDRERSRYCRRQVIAAKDRARFAAASPKLSPERQAAKREMAQWMLVWLDDPSMFPAWAEARKRVLAEEESEPV